MPGMFAEFIVEFQLSSSYLLKIFVKQASKQKILFQIIIIKEPQNCSLNKPEKNFRNGKDPVGNFVLRYRF